MGIFKQFFNNTRKPDGWMGKLMVNGMNQGHAAVSDWGLSYFPDIPVAAHSMVADFGCGGGRNTAALLKRLQRSQRWTIPRSLVIKQSSSTGMRYRLGDVTLCRGMYLVSPLKQRHLM